MNFLRNANRTIITEMVTVLARKIDHILKKSLGRPYPLICTRVNGENLQFVKYHLAATDSLPNYRKIEAFFHGAN